MAGSRLQSIPMLICKGSGGDSVDNPHLRVIGYAIGQTGSTSNNEYFVNLREVTFKLMNCESLSRLVLDQQPASR